MVGERPDHSKAKDEEQEKSHAYPHFVVRNLQVLSCMIPGASKRIAVIAADGFDEIELVKPVHVLRNAEIRVDILSLKKREHLIGLRYLQQTLKVPVNGLLEEANATDYDALYLPGGALGVDSLRTEPLVQNFINEIESAGKPIAAMGHAAWLLISAGLVRGRSLTSYHTIQDDVRNAGGTWLDRQTVCHENWLTSRQFDDIPAFSREILRLFSGDEPLISPESRILVAKSRIA